MPSLRAGFRIFRMPLLTRGLSQRLTNTRRERYLFIFWRIANLVCTSLVANDGTHLHRISLKICRDSDVEREGHAALVNVDRLFGKFEFAVVPARVIYRADLNAAAADLNAGCNSVLAARAV